MSKLEMSIQECVAGFFWSVMEQQPEGYWEPTMDRSLGYFKTHHDCRIAATEWCDEIGIPHPTVEDDGSHVDVSMSPTGELEVSYS